MVASPGPDRSADGRWLLIGGRRWRASDPTIPDGLRAELVAELMDARRAVGRSGRAGEHADLVEARRRVQDAKLALGERGEPWWEEPTSAGQRTRLAAAMRALANHRAPRTICPSDAARAIGGAQWRDVMDESRDEARQLAQDGHLEVLQRNARLDPAAAWRGPIRLRRVI